VKILLTGGSGFIGSHLVNVLGSDDLVLLGRSPAHNFTGTWFCSEINGKSNFSECLRGIDIVVHCAGRAHITTEINSDPVEMYRAINCQGTENLAKQAAQGWACVTSLC